MMPRWWQNFLSPDMVCQTFIEGERHLPKFLLSVVYETEFDITVSRRLAEQIPQLLLQTPKFLHFSNQPFLCLDEVLMAGTISF
jgi:hypothetical protein